MAVHHVKIQREALADLVLWWRTERKKTKKSLYKIRLMNFSWKLLEEITRNPTVKKNSDSSKEQRKSYQILTFKNCTNCPFNLYTLFLFMFEHVSMNHCTYFPIFQAKFKDVMGSSRLFQMSHLADFSLKSNCQ